MTLDPEHRQVDRGAAGVTRPSRPTTASERHWLEVRGRLRQRRYELGAAAARFYPDVARIAWTPLLGTAAWLPDRPLPFAGLDVGFVDGSVDDAPAPAVTGTEPAAHPVLPCRADGTRCRGYAEAMAELASPAVFENRPTYRLLDADLSAPPGRLRFGRGRYFDGIDVGESVAHEYAAGLRPALRSLFGNPFDLRRRPANVAVSALTIRHDRATGRVEFPLHRRDAAKVGHAGGLLQIVPVGVFQPSSDGPSSVAADLPLWRFLLREYSEELLGEPEREDGDHRNGPLATRMTAALDTGEVRAHTLALGSTR